MLNNLSTNTASIRRPLLALVLVFALALFVSLSHIAFAHDINDENTAKSEKEAKKKERAENKTDAKTNTTETAKEIEALEERIRVLEEKLARLSGETPAVKAKPMKSRRSGKKCRI
jgi:flagellar motility protein MotE (MotC chaperone)